MAARNRKVGGQGWSRKKKPRSTQTLGLQRVSKSQFKATVVRDSKTCSAAVQAVFNTTELLENILVHVEFYSLLRAQRVCTLFRDAIAGSSAIKQKLFLSAEDIRDRWAVVGYVFESHFIQLAADTRLPPPPPMSLSEIGRGLISPKEFLPVRVNPILECRQPLHVPSEGPAALATLADGGALYKLRYDLNGYSSGSSWCRMYLCNPPCTELSATVTFEVKRTPEHSATVQLTIEDPDGITFGTLVDRAMERPCRDKNGKKCAGFGGSAGDYVRELERLNERPAYIRASMQSGLVGTAVDLLGVVVPSERQWRDVAAAARRGQ